MAEIFNNYLTAKQYAASDYLTIVPKANDSLPTATGSGSRTKDTVVQLHSIYVTQEISGITSSNIKNYRENPLDYAAYITLSVVDNSTNNEYIIINNSAVLPLSAFYIEKTITLRAQDSLKLTYTSANSANKKLHTICSGVEIA